LAGVWRNPRAAGRRCTSRTAAAWQAEYEALNRGDPMYVRKLARDLEYFNG